MAAAFLQSWEAVQVHYSMRDAQGIKPIMMIKKFTDDTVTRVMHTFSTYCIGNCQLQV